MSCVYLHRVTFIYLAAGHWRSGRNPFRFALVARACFLGWLVSWLVGWLVVTIEYTSVRVERSLCRCPTGDDFVDTRASGYYPLLHGHTGTHTHPPTHTHTHTKELRGAYMVNEMITTLHVALLHCFLLFLGLVARSGAGVLPLCCRGGSSRSSGRSSRSNSSSSSARRNPDRAEKEQQLHSQGKRTRLF